MSTTSRRINPMASSGTSSSSGLQSRLGNALGNASRRVRVRPFPSPLPSHQAPSSLSSGAERSNQALQNQFNPKLIFSQIVALQCFHYLLLGFIFQINHVVFNTSITIDRIFTDQYLHLWKSQGWPDDFAVLLSYLLGAVLLAIIVEKSKKCLDFSVTLFLIHLFSCYWYDGLPRSLDWWVIHVLGTIVMILLGEYLCSLKELSEIPLLAL